LISSNYSVQNENIYPDEGTTIRRFDLLATSLGKEST